MAMANVATELASRGLRVLAIDFDLEAPGLERYFQVPVEEVHASRGVIDLIDAFKRTLSGSGSMAEDAEFRRLSNYILRGIVEYGRGARLDLMPAGRRASDDDKRAYALAVRTFDWQDFYFNWEGEAFFEWLRRTLIGPGEQQYDVVLADSRTGVTEMGGVCACQLADAVVMLCAPNRQNIEVTRELAADLNSPEVQRLRRNRAPLQIVVVPARVEQRLPELRDDFEQRFDAAFAAYRPPAHIALGMAAHDLALPYVPEWAFNEQVMTQRVSAGPGPPDRWRHLTDALLVLADDSVPAAQRNDALQALQPQGAAMEGVDAPAAFDPTTRSAGVDAYLSCAQTARGTVRELLAALEASGQRLRIEFGEAEAYGNERDLPPTASEQLRHAQVLVLFADARGVRPWQRAELKLARSLPRVPAIVQVLLPDAAEDAFELAFGDSLRDCTLIDLRRWPDERSSAWLLAQALERGSALRADGPGSAAAAAPDSDGPDGPDGGPFPGAVAYGEGDAAVFGGRAAQVEAMRVLVLGRRRMVLVGPAGAGKTSLVRAGLFPALRGGADVSAMQWVDLRGSGGDESAWRPALNAAQQLPASALVVIDHADEAGDAALQAVAGFWQREDGPRLLLVWRDAPLAQSEAEASRRWALEGTAAAARPEHPLHHACSCSAAASALLELAAQAPSIDLAPLDGDGLRAAAEAALARAGRRAETGLLERLFGDAGTAPSAAAVQRVLRLLWAQQLRGWLTNDAYDRAGGIDGPFLAELERQLGAANTADREALHSLLLRLLRRGDDGSLHLRPFSWARGVAQPVLGGRAAVLVQALAAAGVLVVQRQGQDLQVTLAHKPRDWAGLDPLFELTGGWRAHVFQIATAYASWAAGGCRRRGRRHPRADRPACADAVPVRRRGGFCDAATRHQPPRHPQPCARVAGRAGADRGRCFLRLAAVSRPGRTGGAGRGGGQRGVGLGPDLARAGHCRGALADRTGSGGAGSGSVGGTGAQR
jgi:cellulose biosynthesis protein BcsQ